MDEGGCDGRGTYTWEKIRGRLKGDIKNWNDASVGYLRGRTEARKGQNLSLSMSDRK